VNPGEGLPIDRKNVQDIQHQIEQALRNMPDFEALQKNVVFRVTGEGAYRSITNRARDVFHDGKPNTDCRG
jgi:hypothetical protein